MFVPHWQTCPPVSFDTELKGRIKSGCPFYSFYFFYFFFLFFILAKRKLVLEAAKEKNPLRWSGDVQNCEAKGPVTLNPDRDIKIAA